MSNLDSVTNEDVGNPIDSGKSHARHAAQDIKTAAGNFKSAAETKAQELREAAASKAQELRETATSKAQEYKGLAGDKAQEFRGRAGVAMNEAGQKAQSLQKESERYVRENPMRAVLTAFGAGIIFGLLIRR